MWLYNDGGTGLTKADIFATYGDNPSICGLMVDKCGTVNFVGYESDTLGNNAANYGRYNWLEFGSGSTGSINFYAKGIYKTSMNHPWKLAPGQNVQFHNERTLATGAAVPTYTGSNPLKATDENERSYWEDLGTLTPFHNSSQHYIVVDLGSVHAITGVGYDCAAPWLGDLSLNSPYVDVYFGTQSSMGPWTSSLKFGTGTSGATNVWWEDLPLKSAVQARYVSFCPAAGSDGHIHLSTLRVYGY